MSPREIIDSYCRQYAVPSDFGLRMLPLVERAQEATPGIRERILSLVQSTFEKEAGRQNPHCDQDLRAMAEVLHTWPLSRTPRRPGSDT